MTVYLDLIWLLNLGIDFLLLSGTALLLKRRLQYGRLFLGALFASLIVFFMFTSLVSLFMNPLVKLAYSAIIVFISFGYKRLSYFLQTLSAFYFITFVTGGGLFAMHYFLQTDFDLLAHLPGYHGHGGSAMSWAFVLIGFPLLLWFSKHQMNTFQIKKMNANEIADITIMVEHASFSTRGLIDTGNQLKDPITKTPVMIIETQLLRPFFSENMIRDLIDLNASEENPLMKRARIIPYRAIGQNKRFITAIKPDQVRIVYDGHRVECKNVLLGLYTETLSPEDSYQCIVHPQLVMSTAG